MISSFTCDVITARVDVWEATGGKEAPAIKETEWISNNVIRVIVVVDYDVFNHYLGREMNELCEMSTLSSWVSSVSSSGREDMRLWERSRPEIRIEIFLETVVFPYRCTVCECSMGWETGRLFKCVCLSFCFNFFSGLKFSPLFPPKKAGEIPSLFLPLFLLPHSTSV